MPNEEKKVTGLEGLLNGVPLSPKEQWRIAARVNAMRDVLVEFIAAQQEGDYDKNKQAVSDKMVLLEDKYLEAMNEARAKDIEEKVKDARYRRFK